VPSIGEVARLIGHRATLTTREGFTIPIKVHDVRQAYGRTEALVSPVHGEGRAWVNAERIAS
jgi:hypothetical protein